MDEHERRRVPPVLGDEYDFRERVRRDPRLYTIVTMLEVELHEGRITIDDAVRCGVMAANEYMMRRGASFVIRVEDTRRQRGPYGPGTCTRCGNDRDDPCHDPAYAGGDHKFAS